MRNPGITPEFFMSDKDHAQINSIKRQFPQSAILLCWWHVLYAWQQHFITAVHPELWELLKKWIRLTDRAEFWQQWEKIKNLAPSSIIQYLETFWLSDDENIKMWSAIYRTNRTIFQLCDTNMLVEAWHHLLKGTFMQGKRNRRLDHLIHILVDQAIPHFIHKHHRQEFGFEGADLEVKKRLEIEERAKSIRPDQIKATEEADVYQVLSGSKPGVDYRVDLDAYDCSCLSFPTICFCKHICAVQKQFPEVYKVVPTAALTIHCDDTIEPTEDLIESDPKVPSASPKDQTANSNDIVGLIHKLSSLTICLQATQPAIESGSLTALHHQVNVVLAELREARSTLPDVKKVAPNQHSWTETASVMGAAVKSKKRKNNDPYGGGERSGKKARPDVREPLQ